MIDDRHYDTPEAAIAAMVDDMASALRAGIESRGGASMAVSGGRTPMDVFPRLAAADVDWSRVVITLSDERWVPNDHPDSNEALVRRYLLEKGADAARFVGLKTPDDNVGVGAQACATNLDNVPFPLDVIYLGIGPDGHCASLFPGADWANAPGRCVAVPATPTRQARISLTPSAILDSRLIVVLFSGAEKRAVFDEAMAPGPLDAVPLRVVTQQDYVPVIAFSA